MRRRQAPKLHPQLVRSLNQRPTFFTIRVNRKINSINTPAHIGYVITAGAFDINALLICLKIQINLQLSSFGIWLIDCIYILLVLEKCILNYNYKNGLKLLPKKKNY